MHSVARFSPILMVIVASSGSSLMVADARAQSASGGAHTTPPPVVGAARLSAAVSVDGRLNEEVWSTPDPATNFRQSQPDEGKAATQKTEVRFAYDGAALYVGARMFDDKGAKGVTSRLLRRDALSEADSDILQLNIDSYHSHTSSYFFWINPSGSKRDGAGDATLDPVWEAATQIDSLGWTAEIRIPLNQLNFSGATDQTWGVQVIRFVHRLNERSHFAWWPSNESGGPQRYGHLQGIRITERPRGMELMPYTVARARYIRPTDPANPFTKQNERDYRVGGDLKFRLTSNLTLNAAFNPDFGQVEVDPAVVNLSAFETFFQERRPFFIENQGNFGFGSFSCMFCSNVSNLAMFYTRRIGRAPQLFPSGTYVDQPENATILAAAKVTGRTANNYVLGVLDAVTRREMADVIVENENGSERFEREVEPLTNYFVMRPKKDFAGGAHSFGGIVTSVDRFTDDSLAEARLPTNARSAGIEWFTSRKNRTYTFMGQFALSDLHGSATSINRIQRSSARYFQRPDRESGGNGFFSDEYDPAATNLRGYAGYARVAKEAGTWHWESSVNYRSPGFEVNDISFLNKADYVWMNTSLARSVTKPGKIFRNYFSVLSAQQEFNYDRHLTDRQFALGLFGELRNFWGFGTFAIRTPESYDDRATRGGPVVRKFGYRHYALNLNTDRRKNISLSTNPNLTLRENADDSYNLNLTVTYKPSSNIQLSLGPAFNKSWGVSQFVTSADDPTNTEFFGRQYIFAGIEQKSLSMSTRANVTFTPTLTLEVFAQPLLASGDYKVFRTFVAPGQAAIRDFTPEQITHTGEGAARVYTVDRDGAGSAPPVSFANPDFNFRSLRGNAVMRWEYRPGSTLFLVWQQNRSATAPFGNFDFSRDRQALFSAHPDNIFLVKASYWLPF